MRRGESESPTDFARPERAVPLRLLSGRAHYDQIIEAVTQAEVSVWIATANLKELMIEDHRARPGRRRGGRPEYRSVLAVFDELAARGVDLRILHASPPSRPFRAELARQPRLLAGGLALRSCPRVHLKVVIIDGQRCYLGSANWTGAGLGAKGSGRRNFELGIVSDDPLLLDDVQALYDRLWRGVECASCRLKQSGHCAAPIDASSAGTVQLGRRRGPRRGPPRALPGPGRSLTLAEEGTATPLAGARDGRQGPSKPRRRGGQSRPGATPVEASPAASRPRRSTTPAITERTSAVATKSAPTR